MIFTVLAAVRCEPYEHVSVCVCVCDRLCANVLVTFLFKASPTASAFIISPLINTEKLLTQRDRKAEIKNERERERERHEETLHFTSCNHFIHIKSLWISLSYGSHSWDHPNTLMDRCLFPDLSLSGADYTTHARFTQAASKLAYFDCILKLCTSLLKCTAVLGLTTTRLTTYSGTKWALLWIWYWKPAINRIPLCLRWLLWKHISGMG